MTRRSATPGLASGESAEARLARFMARFDPAVCAVARKARAVLRRRIPAAFELVYDNYNALVIGFGPTERASDAMVSLALYPRWVTLFFLDGAALRDPLGLLSGSGTRVRSIRLTTAEVLDTPGVRALLAATLAEADRALPARGRGRLFIKSISRKQRARRPGLQR
jgi:hypothetical protein